MVYTSPAVPSLSPDVYGTEDGGKVDQNDVDEALKGFPKKYNPAPAGVGIWSPRSEQKLLDQTEQARCHPLPPMAVTQTRPL